jgi:hypothetical protein
MLVKCLNLSSLSSPRIMILFSGRPTDFAAALASARNAFCVTSALAPQSLSWKANSAGVYAGLAGEMTPPAQWVPHITAGVSMLLGV